MDVWFAAWRAICAGAVGELLLPVLSIVGLWHIWSGAARYESDVWTSLRVRATEINKGPLPGVSRAFFVWILDRVKALFGEGPNDEFWWLYELKGREPLDASARAIRYAGADAITGQLQDLQVEPELYGSTQAAPVTAAILQAQSIRDLMKIDKAARVRAGFSSAAPFRLQLVVVTKAGLARWLDFVGRGVTAGLVIPLVISGIIFGLSTETLDIVARTSIIGAVVGSAVFHWAVFSGLRSEVASRRSVDLLLLAGEYPLRASVVVLLVISIPTFVLLL